VANPNPVRKFKKGSKEASLAGKKSSRALPPELKELRQHRQSELELSIYKYINMSLDELKAEYTQTGKPAIDLLVIKCMTKAIEKGDFSWIEPMLARSIGKVADKVDADLKVGVYKLHDAIMAEIEKK